MFSKLAALTIGLLLSLGLAVSASAYPVQDPDASVSSTTVAPGGTVTFTAGGFAYTRPAGRTRVTRLLDQETGSVPKYTPGRAWTLRAWPPNPSVTVRESGRGDGPSTNGVASIRSGRRTSATSVPGMMWRLSTGNTEPSIRTRAPVCGRSRKKCAHVSTMSGAMSAPEQ